jgi:hypothetical protein
MKNIYQLTLILLLFSKNIDAQVYTAPANFSFTSAGTNTAFTTKYILVNSSTNLIAYLSTTNSFSAVAVGSYLMYAVNYDPSGTAPTLTVGTNLSAIGGSCVAKSASLAVTVSAVTSATFQAPASFSFNINGNNSALTTNYILVNISTNLIAYLSTASSFSNIAEGGYTLYGVNYDPSGTAPTLAVGTNFSVIGGSCVALSSSLSVTITAAACPNDIILTSTINDISSGTLLSKSSGTISATNLISGTAKVTYQAAGSISFSPGFKVEPASGGYLVTAIATCN